MICLEKFFAENNCTFSIVICSKNKDDIFEEGYESEAPEDERQHPKDLLILLMQTQLARKGVLVHIHRWDAEVAVHDTEALVRQ